MLNCKNCGAPLTLQDEVCPHCGTPNPEAKEHQDKLRKYDRDFKQTRKEVIDEVKKSKQGYGLLIVLVMLMLANLVLLIMNGASYQIADDMIALIRGKDNIEAEMKELLANDEYVEYDILVEKYDLNYSDYRDYLAISYLADSYSTIINSMTNYFYGRENYSDPLLRACNSIKDFKDDYNRRSRDDFSDEILFHIERLNDEYERYLKYFLKLNDEDIAGIPDMSSSQLAMRIMERMSDEEAEEE